MRHEPSAAWTQRISAFLGDPWPSRAPKLMSPYVRELAIRGLSKPRNLSDHEVQELARSVIEHINVHRHD